MADAGEKNTDAIIVVGDKVDLVVETGHVYRAMIEDRIDNGPFMLAIPSLKGVPMIVHQDDDIYLVFYRESGRYIAQMKVLAVEKRGEVRYMWLLQKTLAHKNQRREAYRLPVSFGVQIYKYDEISEGAALGSQQEEAEEGDEARAVALESADSRDLSVTGIALITRKKYVLEEKFTLVMQVKSNPTNVRTTRNAEELPPMQLNATVKRCIPWRVSGKYNTGMQFVDVERDLSERIAKFVLHEQQRRIRMNKQGHLN